MKDHYGHNVQIVVKDLIKGNGCKSTNDVRLLNTDSYSEAIDMLSNLNQYRTSGFAYLQFERITPTMAAALHA